MLSKKTRFLRATRALHRWAGLALALQLLFWIAGGLIMSVLPLQQVHGDHLVKRQLALPFGSDEYSASLDKIIAGFEQSVESINYSGQADIPTYEVTVAGVTHIFDARTGKILTGPDKQLISALASQHYLGDGQQKHTILLPAAPMEASSVTGPVWQVNYSDEWQTSLYFSPVNGALLKVRSDMWRLFDIVWMLHIMDYDTRDNINNPLLMSFAAAALLFTLSGFAMLWQRFSLRYFQRKARNI